MQRMRKRHRDKLAKIQKTLLQQKGTLATKGLLTEMLYNIYVIDDAMAKKKDSLTILIGANEEADIKELFSGKPINEIIQPKNILYLDSFEQLYKLLSPAKLDLLRFLIEYSPNKKPKTVSEIANGLNRHQEAISRDLGQLKQLGLIERKQIKQTVFAQAKIKSINIKLC
jgi:predicted transcriptional regulator